MDAFVRRDGSVQVFQARRVEDITSVTAHIGIAFDRAQILRIIERSILACCKHSAIDVLGVGHGALSRVLAKVS